MDRRSRLRNSKTATGWVFAAALAAAAWISGVPLIGGPIHASSAGAQAPNPGSWTGCGVTKCHAREMEVFRDSVHAHKGITCNDCHGGDPTVGPGTELSDRKAADLAMYQPANPIVSPDPRTQKRRIAQMCSQCHSWRHGKTSNPFEEYKTSTHGRKLFMEGDNRVAVCTDCHGRPHAIAPVADHTSPVHPTHVPMTCGRCHDGKYEARGKEVTAEPKAYPQGTRESCRKCHEPAELARDKPLPDTKFHEYAASVHGEAVIGKANTAAPTCVSCHSAHAAYPPEFADVTLVCGKCHINEPKQLRLSPHMEAMTQRKISYCITCHGNGNHAIPAADESMLRTTCASTECHGPDVSRQRAVGTNLHDMMVEARERVKGAEKRIERARKHGAELEAMESQLAHANEKLTEAKPVLHSLNADEVKDLVEKVHYYVDEIDKELAHIHTVQEDRKDLFMPIAAFVALCILVIYLKVHQLESAEKKATHGTD